MGTTVHHQATQARNFIVDFRHVLLRPTRVKVNDGVQVFMRDGTTPMVMVKDEDTCSSTYGMNLFIDMQEAVARGLAHVESDPAIFGFPVSMGDLS